MREPGAAGAFTCTYLYMTRALLPAAGIGDTNIDIKVFLRSISFQSVLRNFLPPFMRDARDR